MIIGNIKEVAIIGAGVSGLATAKALKREGLNCTIYDRNSELGGVWADGYSGFGVQVQKDLYQFPDYPLPDNVPDFTPGPQFREYLEAYCDHFGIREAIELSCEVSQIKPPQKPGGKWELEIKKGRKKHRQTADLIVVATGLYSEKAFIPKIDGMPAFKGEIKHSSDVKDIETLRGKSIAVIGYGKSAADIADSAVKVADKVNLVFRQTHWPVPRKLLGLLPFKWGMLTRLTAALIPPYVRPSPAVKMLHSVGYPLPWLFWRIVELLLRYQQGLGTNTANGRNLIPEHPVVYDAYSETTMVPRPGFVDHIRNGSIKAYRTRLKRFNSGGIELEDGNKISADCVIFGTGWQSGYGFLPETLKSRLGEGEDGFYLYRHILHPNVPNFAFIGRASSFMSLTTYALQARWLADVIAKRIDLPSDQAASAAIDELKRWKRSWMPAGPARGSTLLLHMSQYHDELLRDMGKDPLRKEGILAPIMELFVPYTATDFKDVV